jgi:hypothetical protein
LGGEDDAAFSRIWREKDGKKEQAWESGQGGIERSGGAQEDLIAWQGIAGRWHVFSLIKICSSKQLTAGAFSGN